MLLPSFIVLIVFGVLSDATEEISCVRRRPAHCFTPDVGPVRFPDSEEALDKICPIIVPRFKCMVDYKNKCGFRYPGSKDEKLDVLYDLFVEACDKESKFHEELSTHLPCIEKVLMSHYNICKPMVKEALVEITSKLSLESNENGYFEDEEDYRKYHCFSEAFEMTCFVASISVRCGEETKDLVGEVVDRIGILDASCPESLRDEAKEAVAKLLLEMELKLATEEIISKV